MAITGCGEEKKDIKYDVSNHFKRVESYLQMSSISWTNTYPSAHVPARARARQSIWFNSFMANCPSLETEVVWKELIWNDCDTAPAAAAFYMIFGQMSREGGGGAGLAQAKDSPSRFVIVGCGTESTSKHPRLRSDNS